MQPLLAWVSVELKNDKNRNPMNRAIMRCFSVRVEPNASLAHVSERISAISHHRV